MTETATTPGKHRSEYLRILKLADKLHRHGVSSEDCTAFIAACDKRDRESFPQLLEAHARPSDIVIDNFNWGDAPGTDWSGIYYRLHHAGL